MTRAKQPAKSSERSRLFKKQIFQRIFGFYEQTGKQELGQDDAVCKTCHTKIKYRYVRNTNNSGYGSLYSEGFTTIFHPLTENARAMAQDSVA